ncbi:MAG: hypothetical protein EOO01_10975 [Chitinophagaceae bacterium]|nr:MAG: hypothetical protein EOO01_10975 [Chitinophagaceae bacterium]
MNTKLISSAGLSLLVFLLLSFSDPFSVKRISDKEFRYEFYTTQKEVRPKSGRQYYWFKGGAIHNAQAGIAGELLTGRFIKTYHSNQIAEQGEFDNGLKRGLWKTWYQDGTLQSEQYWNDGQRDGEWRAYDFSGVMTVAGKYQKGLRDGRWIDYQKKDTVMYRDDAVFVKKPKLSREEKAAAAALRKLSAGAKKDNGKPSFFKRLFAKKPHEGSDAVSKQPKERSGIKQQEPGQKRPGFFKRLFSRRKSKDSGNG